MTQDGSRTTCLSRLAPGQTARILDVASTRGDLIARRLVDLGMEPGRDVVVGRRAPLGDPTVYQVADYQVSLRRREADLVLVVPSAGLSADGPGPDQVGR